MALTTGNKKSKGHNNNESNDKISHTAKLEYNSKADLETGLLSDTRQKILTLSLRSKSRLGGVRLTIFSHLSSTPSLQGRIIIDGLQSHVYHYIQYVLLLTAVCRPTS